jgi:hypothetical protein
MKYAWAYLLLFPVPAALAAGPVAATQPAVVSLHAKDLPGKAVLEQFAKQAGAAMPLSPPDLLDRSPLPAVTLDLDRQPFWAAMEALSRKTGLQPLVTPDEPYPRFQLGLGDGMFWDEPHVVSGPLVLFVNDLQRTNSVELGKTKHQFDRQLVVNLTAFAEPGLHLLSVSDDVKIVSAVDEAGHSLKPADPTPDTDTSSPHPPAGVYSWSLAVALASPPDNTKRIKRLQAITHVRVQTRSERVEVEDILKARNVSRTVAGIGVSFRSLKKADIEYDLQLSLKRGKHLPADWENLHHSIFNGLMALYDDKGRLVAARATENGGDYDANKINANLRFVREPGVSDPAAGEPFKLVWLAPAEAVDIQVPFELTDLPIPE